MCDSFSAAHTEMYLKGIQTGNKMYCKGLEEGNSHISLTAGALDTQAFYSCIGAQGDGLTKQPTYEFRRYKHEGRGQFLGIRPRKLSSLSRLLSSCKREDLVLPLGSVFVALGVLLIKCSLENPLGATQPLIYLFFVSR